MSSSTVIRPQVEIVWKEGNWKVYQYLFYYKHTPKKTATATTSNSRSMRIYTFNAMKSDYTGFPLHKTIFMYVTTLSLSASLIFSFVWRMYNICYHGCSAKILHSMKKIEWNAVEMLCDSFFYTCLDVSAPISKNTPGINHLSPPICTECKSL